MRVLIVEDDPMLGMALNRGIGQAGYIPALATNGESGLDMVRDNSFDVMILDMNLPKMTGAEVLKSLREAPATKTLPVIVLTAMDGSAQKVKTLDSGADDYMTKPFDFDELLARLRSLTRRGNGQPSSILQCGDIELDPDAKVVRKAGEVQVLTAKELKVLTLLLERKNKIVGKAQIETQLYGYNDDVESNTVEVTIYSLRKKLGKDFIQTVRGIGYLVKQ
jgi:two-component system OmpR family response regulator/two-component system response regulator QseB